MHGLCSSQGKMALLIPHYNYGNKVAFVSKKCSSSKLISHRKQPEFIITRVHTSI